MKGGQSQCLGQWLLSNSLAGRAHLYIKHNANVLSQIFMKYLFQLEAYQVLIILYHQKEELQPH